MFIDSDPKGGEESLAGGAVETVKSLRGREQ